MSKAEFEHLTISQLHTIQTVVNGLVREREGKALISVLSDANYIQGSAVQIQCILEPLNITKMFSKYGTIRKIVENIIVFDDPRDADDVCREMDGKVCNGYVIHVRKL